jgi:hypothetical protein
LKENTRRYFKSYGGIQHHKYLAKIQTTSRCRSKNLNLNAMRHYDHTVNITWVMQHLNTAKKYIEQSGKDDGEATGGSDWKIHASKISEENFFPELWSKG